MCKYTPITIELVQPKLEVSFSGVDDVPIELLPSIEDDVNLTPYKYNGGQLYVTKEKRTKYCVNVDWLEVTITGNFLKYHEDGEPMRIISFDRGEVMLERDEARKNGTKHFKYVYEIYLHGELFAELKTAPRNTAILDENLSQIRIKNHCLYVRGWSERLLYLIQALHSRINNFTRLDIALDGQGFFEFHESYERGFFEKLGKASYQNFYTGKHVLTGFEIGKKSSAKSLTCYNRSQRIQVDNKTYLESYWEKNEMDLTEDVERMELKLKAKAIKQIEDFENDPTKLESSQYLAAIMRMQLRNFYEFVEFSLDTNVSRRERIQPVDWEQLTSEKVEKTKDVKAPNVIWGVKMAIRFAMLEYFAGKDFGVTDLFDQVVARNFELAKKYGITDWYEQKKQHWDKQKEFQDAIRAERNWVLMNQIGFVSSSY